MSENSNDSNDSNDFNGFNNHGNNILVSIQNVSLSRQQQPILIDINFDIHAQELITIIGPNGCGKSTLLKIILNMVKPDSGTVTSIPDLSIGYVPQRFAIQKLMPITVKRFLSLGTNNSNNNIDWSQLISELAIESLMQQAIQNLSGGELQRVLLVRALLKQPQLLILDEPAQGVDISGQAELYGLIKKIKQRYQCAVLLVSHDLYFVMAGTDTVICLNKHICCVGHAESVSRDPKFLKLFGLEASVGNNFALYTHSHDHHHDLSGKIKFDNFNDNNLNNNKLDNNLDT